MHLSKLKISNYKSFFEPKEFKFEPGFNVLLGGNSSGKSSILEAVAFNEFPNIPHRSILNCIEVDTQLIDTSSNELSFSTTISELIKLATPVKDIYIGVGRELNHFYSRDIHHINQRFFNEPLQLEMKKNHSGSNLLRLNFFDWPSTWRPLGSKIQIPAFQVKCSNVTEVTNIDLLVTNSEDAAQFWNVIYPKIYKFSAERSVQHVCSHHPNGELLPNSSNLAYCINLLQSTNRSLFDQLNKFLRRVFPTIHWVGAPPNGNNQFELKVHTTPSDMNRGDLAHPITHNSERRN